MDRGDGYFFVRFGHNLSRLYVFIEETKYPLVPVLPAFLVQHWAKSMDGLPEFFYLNPSDLTAICIEHLMDDSLQEEAIVKTRQRLKLKTFRHKLHAKYSRGRMTFPELDK